MRKIGKKAVLDFLNAVDERQLGVMSDHFGEIVSCEPVDYSIVKCLKNKCENIEDMLNHIEGYGNFAVTRDADSVGICFWR